MQHNPALKLAPFGRWTLRDEAAQRRLALLDVRSGQLSRQISTHSDLAARAELQTDVR